MGYPKNVGNFNVPKDGSKITPSGMVFSKDEIMRFKELLKMNSENKFYDVEYTAQNVPTGGTTWAGTEADSPGVGAQTAPGSLFCPSQGTADYERVGDEVEVYSIHLRGWLNMAQQDQLDESGNTKHFNRNPIRILIVQDSQTGGSQLNAEDVMNDSIDGNNNSHLSFQKVTGFNKFKVLYDKFYIIQNPTLIYDSGLTHYDMNGIVKAVDIFIKFKYPVTVCFKGNTVQPGNISDILTNSFHCICYSVTQTGFSTTFSYVCRTHYKDI